MLRPMPAHPRPPLAAAATPAPAAALPRPVSRFATFLCWATVAAAQQQQPPDLEQLAARVDAAHRTDPRAEPVVSFASDLSLYNVAADADKVEVELSVKFLDWRDGERRRPMIRYKLIDNARAVEAGRDRVDYWMQMEGRVQDLGQKEMQTDREDLRRNLKLAQQMLRFLEPGTVLRGLASPSPVRAGPLRLGRTEPVECWTVSGDLPSFPLRQHAGEDARVRATVWVGKDGERAGRLLALEVTPLDAEGRPQAGKGEFLSFGEHQVVGLRLVPMRIEHFAVTAAGRREAQMVVTLTTLQLGTPLKPEDFDRPKQ
jgi:hypothetical protein